MLSASSWSLCFPLFQQSPWPITYSDCPISWIFVGLLPHFSRTHSLVSSWKKGLWNVKFSSTLIIDSDLENVFLLFLVSNVDTEIAEDILISDLMLWLHLYFSLGTSSFLVFWYFMTTSDDVHYMIYQISWWCTHYMMCIGVGILLSFYLDSQWVLSFWKFIPLESGTVKKSYLLIYFSPFSFFFFWSNCFWK